jgi:uncharacterized protein YraI
MYRRHRKMLLNLLAGLAVAAGAAFVFMPAAAVAAPGTATAPVNVRSGPGPSYGVIDQLQRGQRVDVGACRGSWCEVDFAGGSGWVSSNYLSISGSRPVPVSPDVGFGISIGSGGVSVGVGVGTPRPPVRPPVIEPVYGEVCFYERSRYRGASTCIEAGDSIRNLGDWAYRIGSIENPDELDVRVCTRPNFRGSCRTYTTSASTLGGFDGEIASVRAD